jgi:hypothetical protein
LAPEKPFPAGRIDKSTPVTMIGPDRLNPGEMPAYPVG